MKVIFGVLYALLFTAMALCQGIPAACFAGEYELSADPRLAEPRKSFEQAQGYMEKGNEEFGRRVGLAQKMFEHAEDYFLKAEFLYKELGQKHGIDVSHEISACERSYRDAHVMVGKARKKSRQGKGAGL